MTSFSSLISSELAEKMKNKEDEFIKGKSQLGVLRTYLNLAVASGILNIMLGCIVLLYKDILKEIYNTIYYLLSSIVFSTFGLNLTLMYLLYNFMVNRQLWSK